MRNPFISVLARLSVGRKLLLIYLLDMTAVIFISGILINEKYIAINFARDETRGNGYISVIRDVLLDVTAFGASAPDKGANSAPDVSPLIGRLNDIEQRNGAELDSRELEGAVVTALGEFAASPSPANVGKTIARGRDLLTRVGNESKMILDPDLDSYYTMSLTMLRYPELLELVHEIATLVQEDRRSSVLKSGDTRTRYLILEGRLDATAKGIDSDFSEASTAGGAPLKDALGPEKEKLALGIEAFRVAAREAIEDAAAAPAPAAFHGVRQALLTQLRKTWSASAVALDNQLDTRITGLFQRMFWHLGTAAFLLAMLLTAVYFVARQIAVPLRRLSTVTDKVRQTGDYALRASWQSEDEIGRLVLGFNGMLAQLDHERQVQKELAANARAAAAQKALVEATPIPIVVTAVPGHEVLHANVPAQQWLAGRVTDPWSVGLDPDVRARFFQHLAHHDLVNEFEVRWKIGTGAAWAVLSARRMQYQGQDAILTVFSPINHLKQLEQRLELWAKVFEASSEGIMIVNADERIMSVNRAFVRSTGFDFQDATGERPDFLIPEDAPESARTNWQNLWRSAQLRGSWQGELELRRRNGERIPVWLMISTVRESDGRLLYYICTTIDITDRKKSEARITFLAHHDVLTELPNRSLCIERLRSAIQHAERSGQMVAVLFIDLDRFKNINDSLGHHIGDGLLRSVARTLSATVRKVDTVSRLGGDEFVVVLSGVHDADEVKRTIEGRLLPQIRMPHMVEGHELYVSCSVGIAMYPADAPTIDELMRLADVAMYHAKSTGRDCAYFFTAEMTERAQRRLQIESQLRHAIDRDELSLHYQPCVNATTGALISVEGLLRWASAELGGVAPAQFVPIAEETGLIVPIGAWVIDQACAQITEWQRSGAFSGARVRVSVNLSASQLRSGGLLAVLASSMQRHGIGPGLLEMEITESTLMEGIKLNMQNLVAIRALGVGLAIDDFGTGYSSLSYLGRFPIDKLKIDRSFVRDIADDLNNLAITRSIINLGHTLGLTVVAEGVERESEAEVLRAAGCDEFQGFFYGTPMPPRELEEWHRARTVNDDATPVIRS